MRTACLQCGCGAAEGAPAHSAEFCSLVCEEAHREKILGRLSELSDGRGHGDAEAWRSGLMSLAQTTADLRYSNVDMSSVGSPPPQEASDDSGPLGRLIVFLPAQGGSGASTTALHVAEAIARDADERVLLIDYDFHSGTTAFRLGLQPEGVLDDLLAGTMIDTAGLRRSVSCWGALDVLVPASERSPRPLDFSRLDDVIRLARQTYTSVIVDHPDALYTASRAVLSGSSFVGIVCTPDISALYLVRRKRRAIASLLGREPQHLGLIINRSTSWGSLDRADVERVAEAPIVASLPNDYAAVRRASWQGGLIEQDSALAAEMLRLAESISIGTRQTAEVVPGSLDQRGT